MCQVWLRALCFDVTLRLVKCRLMGSALGVSDQNPDNSAPRNLHIQQEIRTILILPDFSRAQGLFYKCFWGLPCARYMMRIGWAWGQNNPTPLRCTLSNPQSL